MISRNDFNSILQDNKAKNINQSYENEDEIRSEAKMKRTCNSGIDNVIEEVRNAYEEGKNLSFIKDPIAYALWITWMAYEAKHEEQTRGD